MKYFDNDIYPVALVLSQDSESVDREYYNAIDGEDCHITVKPTAQATTMFLSRRAGYHAMAVGIIFNKKPGMRLAAHEAFHATRMMAEIGCHILLDDSSEKDSKRYCIIVWLGKDLTSKDIAHESYHALAAYYREINATLPSDLNDNGTEEMAAYLIGWIFDCINKVRQGKVR